MKHGKRLNKQGSMLHEDGSNSPSTFKSKPTNKKKNHQKNSKSKF